MAAIPERWSLDPLHMTAPTAGAGKILEIIDSA